MRARFSESGHEVSEWKVDVGPIAASIIQEAAESTTDLIVVGAGERSEAGAVLVGPVVQAVMEQASQPVLAVSPTGVEAGFRAILCPVDHSDVSRRGLQNAIRLADVFQARLIVLSVVPEVNWLVAAAETGELTDLKAEYAQKWCEELDSFLKNVGLENVRHTKLVRSGAPHEQIVAVAREEGIDLIVMGATGRTGLVRVLLGSTTRRVLRDLPCSLLTVKQEGLVPVPLA